MDINARYSGPIGDGISFDDDTLLNVAAYFGHLDIMEYLINAGADLSAKCNLGNTALANAIMANQFEAFKLLIAKSNTQIINSQNNSGETLLHMAMQKDKHEFIKELLHIEGIDPNIPDGKDRTPLMVGIWSMKSLRLLLEDERTNINDKVYELIFLNNHLSLPVFCTMQEDDNNWHKMNTLFLEKVPSKFLCGKMPQNRGGGWPYIDFIFSFKQKLIPQLLKMLSELGRGDVFLKEENVASIYNRINNPDRDEDVAVYLPSSDISDYKNAREAIEKYCEKDNATGNYRIVCRYLLPIKDCNDKFQQHFKDIYSVIDSKNFSEIKKDSEDFNKIKESLQLIKENVKISDIDVDDVSKALTVLVEEAKFNEHVARLISDCQADITYPESYLKSPDLQKCESTYRFQ